VRALNPLDAASLLSGFGPWVTLGIFLVVFAETGLLIGFVLPGDSLLLTAGLLCATGAGRLSLPAVLAATSGGALLGAQTGYWIGRYGGRALRPQLRNRHVQQAIVRAEALLSSRGVGPALIAARFLPIVRTVMGPLSGMLGVPARTFLLWQSAGGLLWAVGTTLAGYALGRIVPGISALATPALALTALAFPLTLGAAAVGTRIRTRRARARGDVATTATNTTDTAADTPDEPAPGLQETPAR
jgi:membrane-associated protein